MSVLPLFTIQLFVVFFSPVCSEAIVDEEGVSQVQRGCLTLTCKTFMYTPIGPMLHSAPVLALRFSNKPHVKNLTQD